MISKEMEELLSKGAIASVEPDEGQFLSTLFLVFKKDDNQRNTSDKLEVSEPVHTLLCLTVGGSQIANFWEKTLKLFNYYNRVT